MLNALVQLVYFGKAQSLENFFYGCCGSHSPVSDSAIFKRLS